MKRSRFSSTPCAWNTLFARSSAITLIAIATLPFLYLDHRHHPTGRRWLVAGASTSSTACWRRGSLSADPRIRVIGGRSGDVSECGCVAVRRSASRGRYGGDLGDWRFGQASSPKRLVSITRRPPDLALSPIVPTSPAMRSSSDRSSVAIAPAWGLNGCTPYKVLPRGIAP
jgi:hypothetical protein